MTQRSRRIRAAILKGHHRIGMVVGVFAVLLAVTGVLINHGNSLGWDRQRVASAFWLQLYGIAPAQVDNGYRVGDLWVTAAGGRLYLGAQAVADCASPLRGAVGTDEGLLALCDDALVFFTSDGQLIERVTQAAADKQGLGVADNSMIVARDSVLLQLDVATAAWSPVAIEPTSIQWNAPANLPADLSTSLQFTSVPADLTWERLLLDLHSGRLFGDVGVFVVDVMGVLIALLALSGIWGMLTRRR